MHSTAALPLALECAQPHPTCSNGWKIWSNLSSGMPMPVSCKHGWARVDVWASRSRLVGLVSQARPCTWLRNNHGRRPGVGCAEGPRPSWRGKLCVSPHRAQPWPGYAINHAAQLPCVPTCTYTSTMPPFSAAPMLIVPECVNLHELPARGSGWQGVQCQSACTCMRCLRGPGGQGTHAHTGLVQDACCLRLPAPQALLQTAGHCCAPSTPARPPTNHWYDT